MHDWGRWEETREPRGTCHEHTEIRTTPFRLARSNRGAWGCKMETLPVYKQTNKQI